MQNSIWIAVFLLIILPMLERRRRRNAIIKHVLYNKKRNKENNKMKELAKQFIGKDTAFSLFLQIGSEDAKF